MKLCPHGVCEKSPQRRIAIARMSVDRSSRPALRSRGSPARLRAQLSKQRVASTWTVGAASTRSCPAQVPGGASNPLAVVVAA